MIRAGASVTALPFLPYAADVGNWLAGVGHFGSHLGFNRSVHALPSLASGSRAVALALCAALFVLWIMLVTLLENDFWRSGFSVMGGLIVLSPIVHYWYVSWALVFVPLFPSLAWLALSGTIALYFLVGLTPDWSMPLWAQTVIWTTFGIMLAREVVLALRPLLMQRTPAKPSDARSLAVVVPALNESNMLPNCLLSVMRMSRRPDEVFVVDGGSSDGTGEIAVRLGATVVLSEPGRGRRLPSG